MIMLTLNKVVFQFVNIGLLPKRNYSKGTKVTSNSGVMETAVKDSKEDDERVKETSNYDKLKNISIKKDVITVYKVERQDVIGTKDILIEDLHWKYEFEIYI